MSLAGQASADLFDLKGRVALVTGAAGGLGSAIVQAFAAHGASLVVTDQDAECCQAIASGLRARGVQAHDMAADLADPQAVRRVADSALGRFGRVDVLVCNAGIQGPAGPLFDTRDDDWSRVMAVNVQSAVALTRALVPGMAGRGGGSVVLMASIAALRGNKAIGLYGMSKAALAQLARNLAVEWGPQGVRVNAIAPGLIETPLAAGLLGDQAFMQRRLAQTPLRRVGRPEEVASVALLLASDAGAFVTGQTIVVDGGTTISDGS